MDTSSIVSKPAFDIIIERFISSRSMQKRENLLRLKRCTKKPLRSKDSTISTPKRLIGYINFTYFFTKRYKTTYIDVLNAYLQVRQHFELQEDTIVKGKYILIKKPTKNKSGVALPICTKERIYDMLFEIYMALENPGMSAFWDEVSSQYAYVPQHLTECFVKQCKINVENEACKKLIAAKPIIATKFMMKVEVDLIHMEDEIYKYICHARDHFTKSPPKNIFKFWPTDFITHGQWQ
jgi:hypothetical protein